MSLNYKRGLFSNQRINGCIYLELFNVSQSITKSHISEILIEALTSSMTNMCCSTEGIVVL